MYEDGIVIFQLKREKKQFLRILKESTALDGEIAEVGVYRGGSARWIAQNTKKEIHLFDTFEGSPEDAVRHPTSSVKKGTMYADVNEVKRIFKKYKKVHIYKGIFPETSEPIEDKKFCFVHLDTDLYSATKAGLEFFYPRMVKGGAILIHDYPFYHGVEQATNNFFRDKPEKIEVPSRPRQGLIRKL